MTGNASIESAVGCMRRGAFDYLAKPFDEHRVRTTVRRALERRRLVRAQPRARGPSCASAAREPQLVGRSPRMRALARTIASLRHNESHVLIHGESGTGKELVARAIHAASPRAARRFVPGRLRRAARVDHRERAVRAREGRVHGRDRRAGPVPHGRRRHALPRRDRRAAARRCRRSSCARSRRRRCGRSARPTSVPVDLRIITATHRDLERMVAEGSFRTDLFYRLQRGADRDPAAARAARGHPAARAPLPREARAAGAADRGHRGPTRSSCSASTTGRATCASSRT